ncbi:MAG: hypothetical protein R2761_20845 [Acidimicrobiales bacterium]
MAARYAGLYFAAVLASLGYAVAMADTENMAGVLAIALTLPWSGVGTSLANAVSPGLFDTPWPGVVIVVVGGLINAGLIYSLASRSKSADS